MKPWCRWVLAASLVLSLLLVAAVAGAVALLRAASGEWSHPVRWGPWRVDIGMSALLRIATHPVLLRGMEGRRYATRHGPVQWEAGDGPNQWRLVCAPCRLQVRELGDDSVMLERVQIDAELLGPQAWRGGFVLGDGPHAVRGRWTAGFDAHGATLELHLPDTPMSHAYRLFARQIPEVARARIDGRLQIDAHVRWPEGRLSVQPRIEGFAVSGLGTEALLNAAPACEAPPDRGFGIWLPRAVIAAEDQRFHEHTGYDLRELSAAWSLNQRQRVVARGGSTLSQQLAKLIYTGDDRHHLRKLRELLYAVELDRTLGKARVLHLYLAMAPWGEGLCGASAAARHYLNKRADRLTPTEAAWLASLLRQPDARGVNVERVAWVIAHLRPLSATQRQALVEALPKWSPPPSGSQVHAPGMRRTDAGFDS